MVDNNRWIQESQELFRVILQEEIGTRSIVIFPSGKKKIVDSYSLLKHKPNVFKKNVELLESKIERERKHIQCAKNSIHINESRIIKSNNVINKLSVELNRAREELEKSEYQDSAVLSSDKDTF